MADTLSRDEFVRALVRQNVPRVVAEREATLRYGAAAPVAPTPEPPREFVIVLPWPMLVRDNIHHRRAASTDEQVHYNRAREAVRAYGRLIAGRAAPVFAGPVALHARVWVPDRRKRDVKNFSKCAEDGLEGAAYITDLQVKRSTWEEAGLDAAHPRAEIVVMPYLDG